MERPGGEHMRVAAASLTRVTSQIFQAAGADAPIADEVAAHLVEANLKGHDSHGVGMVPAYVANLRQGHLIADAHAEVTGEAAAVVRIDGHAGFGRIVGREAMEQGLARVRQTGVACIGLRNAHHLGRIGAYGELCAEAGCVSLHFVNVVGHDPWVAPWGGRERRLGTNPICLSLPHTSGEPIVLDMATSAVALGKVRVAWMQHQPLAEGLVVDAEGRPTTDPGVMFSEPRGALGPIGAHKGYGLGLLCEILAGALAGHWSIEPGRPRPGTIINNMLSILIDPGALDGGDDLKRELGALLDYLRTTPPAEGFDRVRIPGEPERETAAERRRAGTPVDDGTLDSLLDAAQAVGLDRDALREMLAEPAERRAAERREGGAT